jgi:hypothetical protein
MKIPLHARTKGGAELVCLDGWGTCAPYYLQQFKPAPKEYIWIGIGEHKFRMADALHYIPHGLVMLSREDVEQLIDLLKLWHETGSFVTTETFPDQRAMRPSEQLR